MKEKTTCPSIAGYEYPEDACRAVYDDPHGELHMCSESCSDHREPENDGHVCACGTVWSTLGGHGECGA
jgi:hypothetical protein